jgi:hypothetical protein
MRNRYKTKYIEEDIRDLLKSSKKLQRFDLFHEPSAGGSTVARRIAYNIGTKDYPTVIVHKHHRIETYEGLIKLYSLTGDKPILAVIEEAQVSLQEVIELERQFSNEHKKVVVLYVRRIIENIPDVTSKNRTITSSLDDYEQHDFEEAFGDRNPERKSAIQRIKTQYTGKEKDFITPFIYGLTAYEEKFLQIESYVAEILSKITSQPVKKTVGFISLIGRYTNTPVSEVVFYRLLGIEVFEKVGKLEQDSAVKRLLKRPSNDSKSWEIRHILIANEVCAQLLSGGRLERKKVWRTALKNWLFESGQTHQKKY